jgi:hypothetical protein
VDFSGEVSVGKALPASSFRQWQKMPGKIFRKENPCQPALQYGIEFIHHHYCSINLRAIVSVE